MKNLNKHLSWAICLVVLVGLSCSKQEQRDLKVGKGPETVTSTAGSKILALNSGTFAGCYDDFGDQNNANYLDPTALANCLEENGGEDLVRLLGNDPDLSHPETPLDDSFLIRSYEDLMAEAGISSLLSPNDQLTAFNAYYAPAIACLYKARNTTITPSVPRAVRDAAVTAGYFLVQDYPLMGDAEYNQQVQYLRSALYYGW